jgi:hypothetical protein
MKQVIIAIASVDAFCSLVHLLFEITLLKDTSIYRDLLLIENLLISGVFVGLAVFLFSSNQTHRYFALQANTAFWGLFFMCALMFRPERTSLDPVREWLPVSQGIILLIGGAACLSLAAIAAYNSKPENLTTSKD